MPTLSSHSRRRDRSQSESEEENDPSDPPSQTANKRRRLESEGAQSDKDSGRISSDDSENDDEDSESSLPDSQPPAAADNASQTNPSDVPRRENPNANVTGPNGFRPGAVVRIKLTNFVTYASAEFFLGPRLNMVIGPNGTGKSTLVCAICLGLGWGPQHLGRAKDPGEFVKHGCREAHIEIELAGPPRFRRNPTIRRTIKREGNRSLYTISGKQASRSQVLKLAQSFSIQIDNLCQFLPQDKVSEFAALTPVELLNSTQRAAAGPEMVEWHENLKSLRDQQKKLQVDNKGDEDMLANLRSRQEMQRADVERMRQRAQVKKRIQILESIRPIAKYKEHHAYFGSVKQNKNNLEQELRQLKVDLEPALRAVNSKQEYCSQIDEVVRYKKTEISHAESVASRISAKIERYGESVRDMNAQIEAENPSTRKNRQERSKIQQLIDRLNRQLADEPAEFDIDSYNEKIRKKRHEMRDIENQVMEIKERRQPLFDQFNNKRESLKKHEEHLSNLDSQRGRQEQKLKGSSPDSFKAYMWIQDNQDKFEKEVFGPPVVSCSVKDPKYADAIESLFQRNDLISFTTQTRNDFRTLQKTLLGEMRLFDVSIRTCSSPLDTFHSPIPDSELKKLGFDGWAKDFLSGPEPVLAMLCSENRLHRTPVALRDISDEEFSRMENGSLNMWVAGKRSYQVNRRQEYGPSATSTRVRQVRPAKAWTSQPVDASVKAELKQSIEILREELRELQAEMDADKAKVNRLKEAFDANKEERDGLEREKARKQSALVEHRAIPERIRQQEAKKRDIERYLGETRNKVAEIRSQQDELLVKKAETAVEYANAVERLHVLYEELTRIEIRLIEGFSDLEWRKHRNAKHQLMLDNKSREVEEAMRLLQEAAKQGKEYQKQAKEALRAMQGDPDSEEVLHSFRDYSMEQLDADIDSEKARLELTEGGDSSIIREFEDRERQIEQVERKLADFQRKLSDYDHAINEIRGRWEPKLEELVQRISDAFSDSFARIGCAGQVALDKGEEETGPQGGAGRSDFGEWSIQIYVKFREHESLSLLDSYRQSGGERAVSTIFYLMALQSLSASPFRVVDEINQGMDPRNERMVHERLVDIACASDSSDGNGSGGGSQYFLITPKLLTGLAYKPGMTVHCINSGVLITNPKLVDFSRATQRIRRTLQGEDYDGGKGKGRGGIEAIALRSQEGIRSSAG